MKQRYHRTAATQYIFVGLVIAGIFGIGYIGTIIMTRVPFVDHFVIPWAAGRSWLFEGINPYESTVVAEAENIVAESGYLATLPNQNVLMHPLINLIFYLPFSLMPYPISRAIWLTTLAISIGLMGLLSFKLSGWKTSKFEQLGGILLFIIWLPGAYAILTGQLTPIILLLTFAGVHLLLADQDMTAGFLLALTFGALPTTILILIPIMVWSISQRRWSIISAYFSGVVFIMIISLLMLPSWPMDWLGIMLKTFENRDWIQTPLMELASILPGIADFLSISLHVIFITYLLTLWITISGKIGRIFTWKLSAVLLVAFLLHIQPTYFHLFLILPAMLLVFRFWSDRWKLFGRLLSWIVIFVIVGVSWLSVNPETVLTQRISLPIFSVSLAMLVIGGLIWNRWWAFRIVKLPFDQ